ncbi:hypothetical protein [Gordonia sp. SL306]|uniref:hypothetical protein n=1 Tax=Gordonia sp. SL306 TaxID=2995145 RepID=UPI002271652A|nr:hypothetical protein [Gordonia sp. SL306]WAC55730.1 hypothetical protein OVA31_00130 [Gordonia sp. SL306]
MLRTKLAAVIGDVNPPMVRLTVSHLAVGHSAHVSARGYIPAAPYFSPGAQLHTVGAWLTDDETAVLDHTEPNYDRMMLSTADHPVVAATVVPQTFSLYVSRHGVLGDPRTASPLPLGSQGDAVEWLGARLAHPALGGPTDAVCRRLAEPAVGARITTSFRSADLARDAGLASTPSREGMARR